MYILKQIVKATKNGMGILVGQVVSELLFKTVKILLWSMIQDMLGPLEFEYYFWVPWAIYNKKHLLFFIKVLIIFEMEHKTC